MAEEELNIVWLKVSRALREYLVGVNGGSDILFMDYNSPLWALIKSRLQPMPYDYKPHKPGPDPDYVRIAIPSTTRHLSPVFNIQANRVIEANPLFRHYLDEQGQKDVEALLKKDFKKAFRAYMTGAISCNSEVEIKTAIDRFCDIHNLEMDDITYEMLRKDWYRYRNRESKGEASPLVKENF